MGQDPLSDPGAGSVDAVDAGSVHAVAAFEGGDAAFGAGAPLDQPPERGLPFDLTPGGGGFGLAGDRDLGDAQAGELVVGAVVSVTAVGDNGPGDLADPTDGEPDGRDEQVGVGRVAAVDVVVEHEPVGLVRDLGLVAELDGLAEPSLDDPPRVGVVERDSRLAPGGMASASRVRVCTQILTVRSSNVSRSATARTSFPDPVVP